MQRCMLSKTLLPQTTSSSHKLLRLIVHATIASLAVAVVLTHGSALGQNAERKPMMLVTWFGPGGISLPTIGEWKPDMITVYDKGTRPVAQYKNSKTNVMASFILFENLSGDPTAQGCRNDAINPIIKNQATL